MRRPAQEPASGVTESSCGCINGRSGEFEQCRLWFNDAGLAERQRVISDLVGEGASGFEFVNEGADHRIRVWPNPQLSIRDDVGVGD